MKKNITEDKTVMNVRGITVNFKENEKFTFLLKTTTNNITFVMITKVKKNIKI